MEINLQISFIMEMKTAALVLFYLLVAELGTMQCDAAQCRTRRCGVIRYDTVNSNLSITKDFTAALKSKCFVDKTLLIRDFINGQDSSPVVKVITAPTKFGKTTVLDMLKRFLSIPVYVNGTRKPLETTDNYRLFCQPKLKICEDEAFVRQHMGQHPVIRIDYNPLEAVDDFDTLMQRLRTVLMETFEEHKYLLLNSTIWLSVVEKKNFLRYFQPVLCASLDKADILYAFTYLSKLLFQHFGTKVILLIDDYDVCCKRLFADIDEKRLIFRYFHKLMKSIFKHNKYYEKAMMAGILRVNDSSVTPQLSFVRRYQWLGDHDLSKYYGLTTEEVAELVKKHAKDEREAEQIQNQIDQHYKGYRVPNQNRTIYSLYSVLNYFNANMTPDWYWTKESCFHSLLGFAIKNVKIKDEIVGLVTRGEKLAARISVPLRSADIINLKMLLETAQDTNMERFYFFLFDIGFLTATSNYSEDALVPLEIPNFEIQVEFSKLLAMPYIMKYKNETNSLPSVDQVMSLVAPGQSSAQYKPFFESIRYIISNTKL